MNSLVSIQNGGVFANSRDVAAKFGKRHADVLRAIDQLIAQAPDLAERNFAFGAVEVAVPNGGLRKDRVYSLDRDGFALLAMGFTGKAALRWKLRYIEAFNAMEEQVRQAPPIENGIRVELDLLKAELAQLRMALAAPRRTAFDPAKMVLRYIKTREVMPRRMLSRKVDGRISPEELDEVCARLEREGKIETLRIDQTGGRPATIYIAA